MNLILFYIQQISYDKDELFFILNIIYINFIIRYKLKNFSYILLKIL